MISQARRASAGITFVNVNTIEFSMIAQSLVNGDTPATLLGMPSCVGDPPNTASMCGVWPGSVSVTVTSNGANSSFMHATVAVHVVALTFHGAIVVAACASVDRLVRESLLPGCRVTPFLLR